MMNIPIHDTLSGNPSTMRISARRGVECFFDVDDVTIRVWGSVWTGREVVELDDQIVSSKYSFRMSTPHEFSHAGHDYKVIFRIAAIMTGLVEIELHRDGVLIDSDQGRHASVPIDSATGRVDWRRYAREILIYALLGGLAGGVLGYLIATLFKSSTG